MPRRRCQDLVGKMNTCSDKISRYNFNGVGFACQANTDGFAYCVMRACLLFVLLCIRCAVYADAFDSVVREDIRLFATAAESQKWQVGNTILDSLYAHEYTYTPVSFSQSTIVDSVEMLVYHHAAWYFYCNENWHDAAECLEICIPFAEKYADDAFLSDTYHNAGLNYFRLGDFSKSADYFKLTYNIDRKYGNVSDICNTLNCIAGTYLADKQPAIAEKYILEAIELNATIDEPERMSVYLGMASEIYYQQGYYQRAKQYAERGLKIERELGRRGQTGRRLSQLASAYIGLGRINDAKDALHEALPLLKESGMTHSVGLCEIQLGDICLKEGEQSNAAIHYHIAADIFLEQGDIYNEARAQQGLYNSLRDSFPQKAMLQLERYNILKDSIYNKETREALSRYNAQYDNDRLRSNIESANHRRKVYITFTVVTILLLAVIIALVIYEMRRRHTASQQVLHEEISVLQQKNEQLSEWHQNALLGSRLPEGDLTETDKEFLSRVIDIVNDELENGNLDIDTVASKLHLTPAQLRNRLAKILGETPRSYIMNIRMQKARHLLENDSDMPIAEVAMHCGYLEPSNFVHAFRKFCGVAPSELRKNKQSTSET